MANPRTIARLEARIHERAAYCLQFEVKDPRAGFITITGVELSKDITSGKIMWSVLGDDSDRSKAEHMLQHAAGYIQRQVAGVLELRRMPHLRWVYDPRHENAQAIDTLIKEARARDREINPALAQEEAVEAVLDEAAEADDDDGGDLEDGELDDADPFEDEEGSYDDDASDGGASETGPAKPAR